MAGNPQNASLWKEADVYVAQSVDTPNPESEAEEFGSGWGLVGLLDGSDGFNESREEEKGDHFAWGGILVRTSRGNFKLTKSFSALEDNPTTRALIWPGSTPGKIVVPRPKPVKIAFETREDGKVRRLITALHAEVDLDGDVTENETDLTKYELVATIFPTGDGTLFIEQPTDYITPDEGTESQTGGTVPELDA